MAGSVLVLRLRRLATRLVPLFSLVGVPPGGFYVITWKAVGLLNTDFFKSGVHAEAGGSTFWVLRLETDESCQMIRIHDTD